MNDIRPISLLSTPAKLLEQAVLSSVKSTLLEHYGEHQFGFRQYSSTTCALISLHEHLTSYLDSSETDGAVILTYDYSRAFDTLKSELIIESLIKNRFPTGFVRWVTDYLKDRKQYVQIGTTASVPSQVTSGVPQGSILGPFLYCVATSSFDFDSDDCHLIKYADDTTLCLPLYKAKSNDHIYQFHTNLIQWSKSMDLNINLTKCKCLTITKRRSGSPVINIPGVQTVDSVCILGVYFNSKATWSDHVDHIVRNASRRFYAVRILRPVLSNDHLKTVYFLLIRSIIEYCSPLFIGLNISDSSRLTKLQKRFHRMLCGSDCVDSCLPSLDERRSSMSLKLLKDIMNQTHILNQMLPSMSSTGRFLLPRRNTSKRSNCFFLRTCSVFNSHCKR